MIRVWVVGGVLAGTAGCQSDPFDMGQPRSCETEDQNEWVYNLLQHVYLWADEIPNDLDPATFESPLDLLVTVRPEIDRWSRISDQKASTDLFTFGQFVGLGFRTRRDPDGRVRIASVHADSPAGRSGLQRGDFIQAINRIAVDEIDASNLWNEVYGDSDPGVTVQVEISRDGAREEHLLTKTTVAIDTVPTTDILSVGDRKVGYIAFDSFVEPANNALGQAFLDLGRAEVDDLVVDLRYNGGGLLSVAQHLASLIAGRTNPGELFFRVEHNELLRGENWKRKLEVVGASISVDRVVFITTGSTLSASELVINGLLPHVETYVVGGVTGGKPVGSLRWNFCEQTIFPITFRVVNAEGVTDYFDGLSPDCVAGDDLEHPRGNPDEGSLAEALHLLDTGQCSANPIRTEQAKRTASGPAPHRADGLRELLGGSW